MMSSLEGLSGERGQHLLIHRSAGSERLGGTGWRVCSEEWTTCKQYETLNKRPLLQIISVFSQDPADHLSEGVPRQTLTDGSPRSY